METKIKLKRPASYDAQHPIKEGTPLAYGEPVFGYYAGRPVLGIGTGATFMTAALFRPIGTVMAGDVPNIIGSGTDSPPSTGTQAEGKIYIQYID